ncbi:hypothetical protein BDP27DRAFT_1431972 [Rhodocollybia butyracea]|uniref:Uncharacterized protein n=1 Tax=Rhodocollybia butyracea TaxID=206335 RepID=A0A9P5P8R0_9AGAR|nr:hypothetical protein BDP27DRAFT_1431972 [Rhodocollybia butyracea]
MAQPLERVRKYPHTIKSLLDANPSLANIENFPGFSETIQAGTPLNVSDLFNAELDLGNLVYLHKSGNANVSSAVVASAKNRLAAVRNVHARLEYGDVIAMLNNIQTSISGLREDMNTKFKGLSDRLDQLKGWR